MSTAAIRGAITVSENTALQVEQASVELLERIIERNRIDRGNIVFLLFTSTKDLDSQYPAAGVRKAGYTEIPMVCVPEMPVEGSLEKCIRVLVLVNMDKAQEVRHVYLEGAKKLRPDLSD